MPDANGIRHFTTAEALKETGDEEGFPSDAYTIVFADGPFTYQVQGSADPGEISKKQIEEVAPKVHDRVKGAPPPGTAAGGY